MSISQIPKSRLGSLNIGTADIGTAGLPLSVLSQSGAATNDFAQWNGTAWVPAFVPGAISFVDAEIPSGSANSVNLTFNLAGTPDGQSLQLFVGGQLMSPGSAADYTLSTATITFTGNGAIPGPNDSFLAYYRV